MIGNQCHHLLAFNEHFCFCRRHNSGPGPAGVTRRKRGKVGFRDRRSIVDGFERGSQTEEAGGVEV